MLICSQCKRSYSDQDFRICPLDGSVLSQDETPVTDPLLGKVLAGRFRIVEKIGQGGMGCVYKALHTQMDRVCAIKMLSPLAGDNESTSARFRREAKMTSRIDSPNAVTIYDFGEADPGQFYLAMEYIEGESLAHVLTREKSLPIERVVDITNQIARALSAAHALGIVHRDLKPANIMLTHKQGSELVKVLDFGIAKTVTEDDNDKLTQTGHLLGTPTFMSPEQVLGESIDSRSDVYSLAIIVYQMLSGSLPFDGENVRTLIMKRINEAPKPLRAIAPYLSAEIEQAVMRGLEREPSRRIADVDQFAAALRSAAASAGHELTETTATILDSRTIEINRPVEPPPKHSPQAAQRNTALPSPTENRADDSATIVVPRQPAIPPPRTLPEAEKRTGLALLLIPAFVLVLLGGVAAAAYWIYSNWKSTTQVTTTPTTQPASSSAPNGSAPRRAEKPSADAHFEAGKRYQQEAVSLGSSAEAVSKNNAAVSEYRKALESRSNFPEAHENLGVALYNLGNVAEAIVEYETAIEQYGKPTAQVLTNYGMALMQLKRFSEAANAFAKALALNPNDSDIHYYRGFALHHAGDEAESREAFTRYLEQAPQGPHAKDARNILEHRAVPTLTQRAQ